MCGILGGTVKSWDYKKGIDSIFHRGPDAVKVLSLNNITLAFTRLAVRDLTDNGMQPMVSSDGNVYLVCNGEIYGYELLKKELQLKYHFKSNSDTELIMNAYLEYGDNFVDKIDGMFAIAIYDTRCEQIKLFRDRTGIKPLYYYYGRDGFAFSSELKALENANNSMKWQIDETAIYDYLYYYYIPEPKTMYRNVKRLRPGRKLIYDVSKSSIISNERYWQLKVNQTVDRLRTQEDINSELRYLIEKSVKDQLVADVPVGTFLSGGIDSSIITYESAKINPDINAYSIGFTEIEYDESAYAKLFCEEKGINLKRKILNAKEINKVRKNIRQWYDEPFADTSAYPTFLVSKFAKNDVTVALTGDGGDELFGGYNRYLRFQNIWESMNDKGEKKDGLLLYFHKIKRNKLEREAISSGLGFSDRELLWEYRDKLRIRRDYDPYDSLSKYDNPDLPPFTRMRYLDFKTYLPSDILTKVDRVSMAVSLETRVPFLSREIVEFAFSLSQEECNHDNILKACLKDAYDKIIPHEILYGIKKGFSIPTGYMWRERHEVNLCAGILKEHWGDII